MASNPFRDRMLTIGVLRRGRTKPKVDEGKTVITEGSGIGREARYKAVTDELNNTVTEYSYGRATGSSDRQDVELRPKLVDKREGH